MPVCDLKNEHFLYHAPARFYQEQYLPLAQELCPKDTALLWPVESGGKEMFILFFIVGILISVPKVYHLCQVKSIVSRKLSSHPS